MKRLTRGRLLATGSRGGRTLPAAALKVNWIFRGIGFGRGFPQNEQDLSSQRECADSNRAVDLFDVGRHRKIKSLTTSLVAGTPEGFAFLPSAVGRAKLAENTAPAANSSRPSFERDTVRAGHRSSRSIFSWGERGKRWQLMTPEKSEFLPRLAHVFSQETSSLKFSYATPDYRTRRCAAARLPWRLPRGGLATRFQSWFAITFSAQVGFGSWRCWSVR